MNATLFDPATFQVRPDATETQLEAASRDRRIDRERVRKALLVHGPMTDHEIAEVLGEPDRKPTFGKRRQELGCVPVIVDGKPLRRATPLGCTARVWRLPS